MKPHIAALSRDVYRGRRVLRSNPERRSAIPQRSAADPLPSWNQGPAKNATVDFVARTDRQGTTRSSLSQAEVSSSCGRGWSVSMAFRRSTS